MTSDNDGLARLAGFFSDVEIDRDDYPEQHPDFIGQLFIVTVAMLFVGCFIGLWWCMSLWPLQTVCVSILNGSALAGVAMFRKWEAR